MRALAILVIWFASIGAVVVKEESVVTLLRGTTTVGSLASWEACRTRALELANADTRTSGTVTYTCQTERRRVVATYSPNPVCPALPAVETRSQVCPSGTTGTWTQTRSYATAPYPQCSTPLEWVPAAPPAGTCPAIQTVENLPVVCTASSAEGRSISGCAWGSQSFRRATSDSLVRYCAGTCSSSTATWRKFSATGDGKVEVCTIGKTDGSQIVGGSCGTTTSWGDMAYVDADQVARTAATPVPPVVEPPTGNPGTATVSWTAPTQNSDGTALNNLAGYRIYASQSQASLGAATPVTVGPSVTGHTLTGLAKGTWFFGVTAFTADSTSPMSNVVSKVVQ